LNADRILIDERDGRRIAMDLGFTVTGLLGVLAAAKKQGLIQKCQPILDLDQMIRTANFWIGDELRARYLRGLKEID
jgi:predicted nucleic acid-binding protein